MGTASSALDGRLDFYGTYAQLKASPTGGLVVGTQSWTTDQGEVHWTGSNWVQTAVVDGLVANSGGVQAGATALPAMMNRIGTVGGAGYSCVLPISYSSAIITVTNGTATATNIFPNAGGTGTEAINALGANAAFSLGANKSVDFVCYTAGQWFTNPLVP